MSEQRKPPWTPQTETEKRGWSDAWAHEEFAPPRDCDPIEWYRGYQEGKLACQRMAPEMANALRAAMDALKSYQYGNTATDLAEEIADHITTLLAKIGAP